MEPTDPMESTDPMAFDPSDDPMTDLAASPAAAEVLGLAAGAVAPPAALRGQVLSAALGARSPGRPAFEVEPAELSAPAAFARMLRDVGALVSSLTDHDGTRPTIEGWTVAGLLGHLTAIDEHFGAVLGWWPEAGPIEVEHDHLAMTLPAVAEAQIDAFGDVQARWAATAERILERLDSLEPRLAERVAFHGFDFSIRALVIARTFEVWTHSEDIASAVGRTIEPLDTALLRLMSDAAVGALPIGMLLNGIDPAGRTVRIVLEGEGGGTWVQALELDGVPGEPELTLVADAIEFCRVAAKRRSPSDLHVRTVGDPQLADDVLVAAAVFAA